MSRRLDGGDPGAEVPALPAPEGEIRATMLEYAEEPGLWIPLAPPSEVLEADGYAVVTSLYSASVERVRIGPDDVERAVEEVRVMARGRGWRYVTWWLGELTEPRDLAERLLELGLAPDADEAQMTSYRIDRRPNGEPAVQVHRVETADEFVAALELDWDVWGVPEHKRAGYRPVQRDAWPLLEDDGRLAIYVAYLDGRPVGFGRLVFAPAAGILLGGSTLPAARGLGVYTSLVHARWDATAARGVPRLAVSAGHMSGPILERLGFESIGKVFLLRDTLQDSPTQGSVPA